MRIDVIPQISIGSVQRIRVGDVLCRWLADNRSEEFTFAVAYMRLSGIGRLGAAFESLLNRRGRIAGAVGIDDRVTTVEALKALHRISRNSTVFHTVSGYIYHPKLYLITMDCRAIAVVGSANLTRDGLFRNIEFASAVHMDFSNSVDLATFKCYQSFINELLDTSHPNVKPINAKTIRSLLKARAIGKESTIPEPGAPLESRSRPSSQSMTTLLGSMFPQLSVPLAPPASGYRAFRRLIVPPTAGIGTSTFVMQLSPFDSSHRIGVPGTPEVLIPHPAVPFFPRLSRAGRKYPDVMFDVVLNTFNGRERHQYRLWYYEQRAVGTRIDEYRLRLDHDTIDLSTPGGGDLLVINKLPQQSNPGYEVTLLPKSDPTFLGFLAMCRYTAQEKKWGMT